MKKVLLILVIALYAFRIWQSTGCKNYLHDKFSTQNVKITVEEQVGIDKGINRQFSRFFHNKLSSGFFEVAKTFAKPFEPKALIGIFGPLGIVLTLYALMGITKKAPLIRFHFALVTIVIFLSTFVSNSKMAFYIVALSLYTFSLWGINPFVKKRIAQVLFLSLFILSLWYFSFNWQMTGICNEIFFN